MSVIYSLRIYPNWAPALNPNWTDITGLLDLDQLPSISISSERQDVPLKTTVSDFSVTLDNSGNDLDAIFDAAKIVGPLPPTAGAVLRAPMIHLGRILFCRLADTQSQWEVVFFGYVDPVSVRFNRADKTVALTAYAPGKLLEAGNAERVNRISAFAPAPPFVITNPTYLEHPATPPGSVQADNSWWLLATTVPGLIIPIVPGDVFRAVRAVPGWVESEALDTIVDDEFHVKQVIGVGGGNLYIQTVETPNLPVGLTAANLELLTPWYRGKTWEYLVFFLINEVNAALAAAGVSDFVTVNLANLPLLPSSTQLFAQLINMSDIAPPVNGAAYNLMNGVPGLVVGFQPDATHTFAGSKADILGTFNLGPVQVGPFSPGTAVGYLPGPDDDLAARILSPNPDLGSEAGLYNGFGSGGNDVSLCGQDIHHFNLDENAANQRYDSTHWCRSPSSYFSGTQPKNFYRSYARGRYLAKQLPAVSEFQWRVEITRFTTPDSGTTWTIASTQSSLQTVQVDDPDAGIGPVSGPSTQVDFKVFKIAPGSFVYCWTDPFKGEAYYKTSATDTQDASFFFPPPAPFNFLGDLRACRASGFVTEGPGGAMFFFQDRMDGQGIIFYFWNGSAFTSGSFSQTPPLVGADFINAIIDRARQKIYIAVGKSLFVAHYVFNAGGAFMAFPNPGWTLVPIDQTNYDQFAEQEQNLVTRPGALLWLTGPVIQNNPGEPNYTGAADAIIAASVNAIYIVSNVAANIVDLADFEGLSVAEALNQLIVVRGYQMLSGADQRFVTDPATYNPIPVVSFRQRLVSSASVVVDLTAPVNLCENCQDGFWLLNFVAVGVQNSKLQLGPFFNDSDLTNLLLQTFSINRPRNPASAAMNIDNRYLTTASFMKLIANIYAQDFLVPQPDAELTVEDPYVAGLAVRLDPLDVVKYLKRSPDDVSSVALFGQGRVFTVDYNFADGLLTVRVG